MLLAAIAFAACGSSGASVSEKDAAKDIMLELSDLPKGSAIIKEVVSEKCSPASYFRSYATGVATLPSFTLPKAELLQDVGVFASDDAARKAFDTITSKAARECVAERMRQRSLQLSGLEGQVDIEDVPRSLPGEMTRAMSFTLAVNVGSVEVERTAILHGRALTALTFISQNRPLDQEYWKSISTTAAGRLDETVSSLEG